MDATCGTDPAGLRGRRLRTLIASLVAVLLAVAAHAVADGMTPSLAVLAPVAVAAWAVAHRLSARRIRRRHLIGLLGGTQVVVHVLSAILTPGHGHGERFGLAAATGVADAGLGDAALMVAAHAVATGIAAFVLGYGERVWWQIGSWVRRRLPARFTPAAVPTMLHWAVTPYRVRLTARPGAGAVPMRAPPVRG